MHNVHELMEKRNSVKVAIDALLNEVDAKTGFTSEQDQKFERMDAEFKQLSTLIKRIEAQEKRDLADVANGGGGQPNAGRSEPPTYQDAFRKWLRFGEAGLDAEERTVLRAGFRHPEQRGTDTQITTTDSLGGYLVDDMISGEVIETLKLYSGMFEACRVYPTAKGGTLNFPTFDGTSTLGVQQSTQGGAVAVNDMTFGNVAISDYTYTSGVVKASRQLLNDAFFPLEPFINTEIIARLGRVGNSVLTTGDGSSKPQGLSTAVTTGPSSVAAISREAILDLTGSVNRAYKQNGAKFMMNDSTLTVIKKLAIGTADDRPLWQPSMIAGTPDKIEGFEIVINDDMPNATTGLNPILFGDFSRYIIRQVAGTGLARSEHRYFEELAVGLVGWFRIDGKLVDSAAIKRLAIT